LTTSPIRVRTFGLMRVRASMRTMASSRTPQARPTPLVQLIGAPLRSLWLRFGFGQVVDGGELQDLQFAIAVGGNDLGAVSNFLVEQASADGRSGRDFAGSYVGFFGGHERVLDFLFLGGVVNLHG